MQIEFTKRAYRQMPGQIFSGALQEAVLLQVQQGEVWLTVEGELEDYFLHSGEVCALPAQRQIVIEAQQGVAHYSLQQMAQLPQLPGARQIAARNALAPLAA